MGFRLGVSAASLQKLSFRGPSRKNMHRNDVFLPAGATVALEKLILQGLEQLSQSKSAKADELEMTEKLCAQGKAFIPELEGLATELSSQVWSAKFRDAEQVLLKALKNFLDMPVEQFDQKVVDGVLSAWTSHSEFVVNEKAFWEESDLLEVVVACIDEVYEHLLSCLQADQSVEVAGLLQLISSMQVNHTKDAVEV